MSQALSRTFPILAALMAGVFSGCGERSEKPAPAAKVAVNAAAPAPDDQGGGGGGSGDVILVGHYGSLTGSEATFGQSTSRGIRLAIKEQNAAGGIKGRQIRLKEYDTQGKTQEAGTAVTRLITDDKVTALLGEVASSLSLAGGAVAQQYGVPMISPSSTNPRVTVGRDMVFRVCFVDTFQGYVVAKFARENLKASRVAVLYDQKQTYSKGLRDEFKKHFQSMGGTISADQAFSGGDQDFSAQLATIRETNPEAIFVPSYYTEAGNIALQARKLGITAPLLGGDGWDSEQLAKIGGAAIEGCYYANHYAPDQPSAEVVSFVGRFQKEFEGQIPDGLAALGYDAAKILFDSMNRAASLGGKDLAKAIGATKGFPGVTGVITIDANRDANKAAVVVKLKGGRPSYVATVEPL